MRRTRSFILYGFAGLILSVACRKAYDPPVLEAKNNYIVVDGIINIGANTITSIKINRTRNLYDTLKGGIPVLHAQAEILSKSGASYVLQDTANAGTYTSQVLTLDVTQQYAISITTAGGSKYMSDFVACKSTPPIDSLYWQQPNDFTVYVDTHDPDNDTHYYRWDYVETWEHDAELQTPWGVHSGMIIVTDSTNQKSLCWTTDSSTDIILASSSNLSKDAIVKFPLLTIKNPDSKLNNKYSILAQQYALTADAYNYWLSIQKTSQKLGTFFDLQPAQLFGNIHCLTDATEPVIGFMSASSIRQKRIFLYQTYLTGWIHNPPVYGCDTLQIPVNHTDYRIYTDNYPGYAPYYFISSSGPLVLASTICLDCTLLGGNNIRPPYWK